MKVTIRDVAERVGVSKAAVSSVLNGNTSSIRVSDVTSERIRLAAKELGYHPNAVARSLSRKRMDTIRLVPQYADWLSVWSGFTSEMIQGVSDVVMRAGYDLTLHLQETRDLAQQVAVITDGRADGALLWRLHDDRLGPTLLEQGFPCVTMFDHSENPDLWSVDCDNVLGGRLATQYLLELGHRRIFHLTGYDRSGSIFDRQVGYERALSEYGISVPPEWIVDVNRRGADETPNPGIVHLLRSADRPTAVFCWYDALAIEVMKAAADLGLRVPQDLSVIGFDSTSLVDHAVPPLTSIRQPIREIAAAATRMLLERSRGEVVEQPHILLAPWLEERRSCAPPPLLP